MYLLIYLLCVFFFFLFITNILNNHTYFQCKLCFYDLDHVIVIVLRPGFSIRFERREDYGYANKTRDLKTV